jgi:hypothetical protein
MNVSLSLIEPKIADWFNAAYGVLLTDLYGTLFREQLQGKSAVWQTLYADQKDYHK